MGPDYLLAGGLALLADASSDGSSGTLVTGGVAGALVLVIGYLLVSNRKDRVDYRAAVSAADARTAAADKRYDDEVADHARTELQLDDERERRRAAEDQLARLATEVAGLRDRIKHLEEEVARQRTGGGGAP